MGGGSLALANHLERVEIRQIFQRECDLYARGEEKNFQKKIKAERVGVL